MTLLLNQQLTRDRQLYLRERTLVEDGMLFRLRVLKLTMLVWVDSATLVATSVNGLDLMEEHQNCRHVSLLALYTHN